MAPLKRRSSVDESDVSFEEKTAPSVAAPAAPEPKNAPKAAQAPMSSSQMALNFGLVGTSCTIAQFTVHWTQTTMVRQQLASAASGTEPGFVTTLSGIYKQEGVTGCVRQAHSSAARLILSPRHRRQVVPRLLRGGLPRDDLQ